MKISISDNQDSSQKSFVFQSLSDFRFLDEDVQAVWIENLVGYPQHQRLYSPQDMSKLSKLCHLLHGLVKFQQSCPVSL